MAKRKQKNTILGLDLGTHAIKAVEMNRSGEKLSVTACSYEEVADPSAYDASIQTVLEAGGLTPKRVVVGISGRSALLQNITIPGDRADDLEDAVFEEAEKYIPYDMAEAQVDYHVFDSENNRQIKCLLAAIRQSDLDDKLEILFTAGISPIRVDMELIALANALETANQGGFFVPDGKPAGIVDFGATKTLIVVTDGQTHIFREFPVGGNSLTEMIAHRIGCSIDEAEKIKREPGEQIDLVKDAIYPGIEDITGEIRSCLDQFKNASQGKDAETLLLSGGLVGFAGVTPLIGRLVRVETRIFDSFGAVDASELDETFIGAHAHEFTIALGLASHARD